MYYEMHGEKGPPVLLIHGMATDSKIYNFIIPCLKDHHKLIVIDVPGLGKNHLFSKTKQYSMDEICQYIILFLKAIAIKKVYCFGHSFGGSIAIWLCSQYPEYCIGILAGAPPNHLHHLRTLSFMYRILDMSRIVHLGCILLGFIGIPIILGILFFLKIFFHNKINLYISWILVDYSLFLREPIAWTHKLFRVLYALNNLHFSYAHTKIQKPVTIVWGSKDILIRRNHILPFLTGNPNIQFYEIKNGNHLLPIFQPQKMSEYICNAIENPAFCGVKNKSFQISISGIRGIYPDDIGLDTVMLLVCSFVKTIQAKAIVLAKDTRPSSDPIENFIISVIRALGIHVHILGVVPTPTIKNYIYAKKLDGGLSFLLAIIQRTIMH